MIKKITKDSIDTIKNPNIKKEAVRYVNIYGEFVNAVDESGVKVDDRSDDAANDETIKKLLTLGADIRNNGKSIAINAISPSCLHCRTGFGSATYILSLACNRDCFFCTNKNQMDYEEGTKKVFDVITDFKYDKKRYKDMLSAALTGGEPLLYPDKCAEFIKKVKKTSKNTATRIYSNGDLVTADILKQLKDAGLDEIRFGLKPDDNGIVEESVLESLKLAVEYIPRVMVEMPIVPGQIEAMRNLMLKIDSFGIFGINILEFLYPWVHADEYSKLGYKVAKRPYEILFNYSYAGGLPVSGSRKDCLELLLFCAEQKVKMGVHYCSLENKLTSQIYHHNFNVRLSGTELFSQNDFFIKTVRGYDDDIVWIKEKLDNAGCGHYIYNESSKFIEFSPKYIELLKERDTELALSYQAVDFDEEGRKVLREVHIDIVNPADFNIDEI